MEWQPHPPERLEEMKRTLARMAAEGDMRTGSLGTAPSLADRNVPAFQRPPGAFVGLVATLDGHSIHEKPQSPQRWRRQRA